MAKKVESTAKETVSQKAARFLKENPKFDPNKTKITKGVEGVRFQSKMYGCYDSGMAPHPEWNPPETWPVGNVPRKISAVFYIGSQDQRMKLTAQYHPFKDFIMPANVDFMSEEKSSAKLSKNGRPSLVLYMSPVKRNSFALNTCAMASQACELTCLDYSGQKVTQQVQRLAIARTDMYWAQRELFFQRCYDEIWGKHNRVNRGKNPKQFIEIAVRFNGTSDIDIFGEFADFCIDRNLRLPTSVVCYDYTKKANKATTTLESEYDNKWMKRAGVKVRHKVTYSLSEIYESETGYDSRKKAVEIMKKGGTVAAVFLVNPSGIPARDKNGREIPVPKYADGTPYVKLGVAGKEKWYEPLPKFAEFEDDEGNLHKFPILDGDATDDLMLDAREVLREMGYPPNMGCVLGLRAKARAMDDRTGFAIPVYAVYSRKNKKKLAEAREYIQSVIISMRSDREVCVRAAKLDNDPVKFFEQLRKRDTVKNLICSPEKIEEGNVIDVW